MEQSTLWPYVTIYIKRYGSVYTTFISCHIAAGWNNFQQLYGVSNALMFLRACHNTLQQTAVNMTILLFNRNALERELKFKMILIYIFEWFKKTWWYIAFFYWMYNTVGTWLWLITFDLKREFSLNTSENTSRRAVDENESRAARFTSTYLLLY